MEYFLYHMVFKLDNLQELVIVKSPVVTIPGNGGVYVSYGKTFKKILAILPFTDWSSTNHIHNPIVQNFTNNKCYLDYKDGSIVGNVFVYVIGYLL